MRQTLFGKEINCCPFIQVQCKHNLKYKFTKTGNNHCPEHESSLYDYINNIISFM